MATKLPKGFEMREDGLVYTSFENLDNYLSAELQKARESVEEIDWLQIRLELLEEIINDHLESVTILNDDGSKTMCMVITEVELETARSSMILRHNELVKALQGDK